MTFNEYLTLGKGIKNSSGIIRKLHNGKPVLGKYLVALNKEGKGLEIYPSVQFVQKELRELDIEVVAIFGSEDDSYEYIRTLTEIAMKRFGKPDLFKALPYYDEEVM